MTGYDDRMAHHCAAFRPPLPRRILQLAFGELRFPRGLDVGCGTGRSTQALSIYCQELVGVDSSPDTLARAIRLPAVTYLAGQEMVHLLLSDRQRLETLAGSESSLLNVRLQLDR